jgi:cyclic-di-GMP phosphodiesterase, flagellum assembly factor TipF
MRLNSILIAICMLLIAGSISAVGYLSYGLSRTDAAVVAIAAFTVLALLNSATSRARDRADIGHDIADVSRATADLGRKIAEFERRIEVIKTTLETGGDQSRAMADPLAAEIELLGTKVRQLADLLAVHDRALLDRGAPSTAAASPAPDAKSKHISAKRLEAGHRPLGIRREAKAETQEPRAVPENAASDSAQGTVLPRADGLPDVLIQLARKAPSE